MKIAVTSQGTDLDAQVDPRFGRAAHILVVDTETQVYETLDNTSNINAFRGAGIQAATMVSESGVAVLLTGYCGPNAFKTLQAAGVKVVNDVKGTVRRAVEHFLAGEMAYAKGANADGHW